MLKGSQTIAFALTLTLLFVAISTNIAYSKQNAERGTYVHNKSERVKLEPQEPTLNARCKPKPNKPCPIISPTGNTPPSRGGPSAAIAIK